MFNHNFEITISTLEKEAWILFKDVVTKFLDNVKESNHETYRTLHDRNVNKSWLPDEP